MTPAPLPTAEEWPAHAVGATFGDGLRLDGYDIPGGMIRIIGGYPAGFACCGRLARLPKDYTVALFINVSDAA